MPNPDAFAFTGTRQGLTPEQKQSLRLVLSRLRDDGCNVAHNGSAIGADAEAAALCHDIGFYIVAHPSTLVTQTATIPCDEIRPCNKPRTRNRTMVDEASLLVACPRSREPEPESGTWFTIEYARRLGTPVTYIWPDGTITQ